MAFLIPQASAEAPISPELAPTGVFSTPTGIEAYVAQKALESGLGASLYSTLRYESGGWQNGQSYVKDPTGPNGREDSWGVCQIHLPSHPDVSKEQALDVEFCVDFTIQKFNEGKARLWTGYRLLFLK